MAKVRLVWGAGGVPAPALHPWATASSLWDVYGPHSACFKGVGPSEP